MLNGADRYCGTRVSRHDESAIMQFITINCCPCLSGALAVIKGRQSRDKLQRTGKRAGIVNNCEEH